MAALELITKKESITRNQMRFTGPTAANVAVIYADAYGNLLTLEDWQRRSRAERRASKFLTRYEIDLSDHHRSASLQQQQLPSKGSGFFFQCTVNVGFRVCDPSEVVRRNITDALAVVYSYLLSEFWEITTRHSIDEAAEAQDEINQQFRSPRRLEGTGIEIFLCRTRLLPDATAQEHLRALEAARREKELGDVQHKADVSSSEHKRDLAEQDQLARLRAEERERQVLAGRPIDLRNLLQEHLARHPDETQFALELLERHEQAALSQRDINDKRSIDLIRYMMEQGLIHSADVEALRRNSLQRAQEIAAQAGKRELAAGSWDEPPPGRSEPVVLVSSHAVPPAPSSGAAPAPTDLTVVIPVYAMVDESPDDESYFDALNSALQKMPAELASRPDVVGSLRFGVLSYAEDVRLRVPLNVVTPDGFMPRLEHRPGSRLAPVFEYLQQRIPQDIQRLKSQIPRVGRPVLHILCASPPEDSDAWEASYRQLTDRDKFPYAPNVVAYGVGDALTDVVRLLAPPPEFGWLAADGLPLAEAASHYISYIQSSALAVGSAHISGSTDLLVTSPAGFEPVGELPEDEPK